MPFEVFDTLEAAVSGRQSRLTSQFALPEALARDNVFGDNSAEQIAAQTPGLSGDTGTSHVATVMVGIAA